MPKVPRVLLDVAVCAKDGLTAVATEHAQRAWAALHTTQPCKDLTEQAPGRVTTKILQPLTLHNHGFRPEQCHTTM